LLELLNADDSSKDYDRVKAYTAHALGKLKDKRAVEPLIAILNTDIDDNKVRKNVAYALGSIGDPQAIEPLINSFSTSTFEADRTAIYAKLGLSREVNPEDGELIPMSTKARQVSSWLCILTARKVLEVWDKRTRQVPFPWEAEDDNMLREMLQTAEEILYGTIDPETLGEKRLYFYDFQTGIERNTIWPTYNAVYAVYETVSIVAGLVAGGNWSIDYVKLFPKLGI
jgi:hypothetical protein